MYVVVIPNDEYAPEQIYGPFDSQEKADAFATYLRTIPFDASNGIPWDKQFAYAFPLIEPMVDAVFAEAK